MQNKIPYNELDEQHGLWEVYYPNGQLKWNGLYINGIRFGKFESYRDDGRLHYIMNFINGGYHGYYEFNWSDGEIIKEYHAK